MPTSNMPAGALVGRVLGGAYRVVQLLGSGGTGDVYVAETLAARSPPEPRVALKVLRDEHRESASLRARFEREATAASRVRHPNVMHVEGTEHLHDEPGFFAMELLVGLDLADTLTYARALQPDRALRIAHALTEGLDAAHAHGIVHRDLKPENVFLVHALDGREIVKVLDFGFAWLAGEATASESARITARFTAVGTPEYMSPEQAHGAEPHPSADIYSLGVVLYEMLTGRAPFTGDSYPAIAHKHAAEPPPPMDVASPGLELSPALTALVERALAKTPAARFPSMVELGAAISATPEWRLSLEGVGY